MEKAVSELPTDCTFCLKQFPRSSLERHQKEECQDRFTTHFSKAEKCFTSAKKKKLQPLSIQVKKKLIIEQPQISRIHTMLLPYCVCMPVEKTHTGMGGGFKLNGIT